MFFKIFRNTEAEGVPSVPTATSVAAAMAQFGKKSDQAEVELPPVSIKENSEPTPPPATEPPPVATTNDTPSAEKVVDVQETPTPAQEPAQEPTPPIAETPAPVQTWQEVLKQQQPDTVLKELGLDANVVNLAKELTPEMVAFYKHWKEKGDVGEYLEALKTDYSKMPAEDVMKHLLRKEYPRASEAQLNILYKKEVIDAYRLDPERFEPEEVEEGRMLLEAKADKHRDTFAAEQQKFLLPQPPEPTMEVDNTEVERQQAIEAYHSQIKESSFAKNILANGKITFGEGDEQFNYPVQGNDLVEILTNDEKWANSMFKVEQGQDGKQRFIPDVEHQMLVALVAKEGKKFINEIAKHYKAIGGKAAIDPIENAKIPESSTPSAAEAPPASVAEAMARNGRLV